MCLCGVSQKPGILKCCRPIAETVFDDEDGKLRIIDNVGRVVIPRKIRNKLNINPNDMVEVTMDEESGFVLIRKA